MAAHPAVAARLRLGSRLQAMRQAARVTGSKAGEAVGRSPSLISRIESGLVGLRPGDAAVLLDLYGAPPAERDELLCLARASEKAVAWDEVADRVPPHARHHLLLEGAAATILVYDPQAVPAVLQVPAYARALCSASLTSATWRGLGPDILSWRRGTMTGESPPRVWALIGTPVLRRAPGGSPGILARQVDYLAVQAEQRHVTIQLVPSGSPAQLAAPGPFALLRFDDDDPPSVVVLEHATGTTVLSKRREVDPYLAAFQEMAVQALPPDDSSREMAGISAALEDGGFRDEAASGQ